MPGAASGKEGLSAAVGSINRSRPLRNDERLLPFVKVLRCRSVRKCLARLRARPPDI